jgi:hypothetical protein
MANDSDAEEEGKYKSEAEEDYLSHLEAALAKPKK